MNLPANGGYNPMEIYLQQFAPMCGDWERKNENHLERYNQFFFPLKEAVK